MDSLQADAESRYDVAIVARKKTGMIKRLDMAADFGYSKYYVCYTSGFTGKSA
jgi:hypothetical protein